MFREEAGDDEFAVRVIDEKPQTTAENELNEAEFDFGDDDHFANDEIEPSLSPGAWKKVSVTKRRMLKFNDLLEESQLPILYAVGTFTTLVFLKSFEVLFKYSSRYLYK